MLLVGVAIGYHLAGGEYLFRLGKLMREVKEIPVAANEVRVIASKYAWHFHYAGKDGVLGAASHKAIAANNPVGLDASDPAGKDDLVMTELVLPCGESIKLTADSADVFHSLSHLDGDFELDAIPGVRSSMDLRVPDVPRTGELRCGLICGPGYAKHTAVYRFVLPTDFQAWLNRHSPPR